MVTNNLVLKKSLCQSNNFVEINNSRIVLSRSCVYVKFTELVLRYTLLTNWFTINDVCRGFRVSQAIYSAPPFRLIYLRTDCLITEHVGTGRINYQHNAGNDRTQEIRKLLIKIVRIWNKILFRLMSAILIETFSITSSIYSKMSWKSEVSIVE